jgi:hypothetical protein
VLRDGHRHRRASAEELVDQTLEVRGETLQDDEHHPGVCRDPRKKAFEGFETACRRTDADNPQPGRRRT